jgi:hypothetical protein
MTVGTEVVHSTFGTGTVVHVGQVKGADAVWVDFDRGDRKTFDPEYAAPHVRQRTSRDRKTPPSPEIRCDTCGARPVAVTIGPQQFCEDHQADYDPHA